MKFHGQEAITSSELILFCIDILKRVGDSITALVSFNGFVIPNWLTVNL